MRIGIAFSGGLTSSEIVECVGLAESLGYESAWVSEGHGGDQLAILGACAVATQQIRLGTSISSVFVRSAPTTGMAAATLDRLAAAASYWGWAAATACRSSPSTESRSCSRWRIARHHCHRTRARARRSRLGRRS